MGLRRGSLVAQSGDLGDFYGIKVPIHHTFPENRSQSRKPFLALDEEETMELRG